MRRAVDLNQPGAPGRALIVLTFGMGLGLVGFVWGGTLGLVLAAWPVVLALHAVGGPVFERWFNQYVPSETRATVLSMTGQLSQAGALSASTGLSLIGDRWGARAGLALSGLLLVPLVWIYGRMTRRPPKLAS